MKRNKQEETIDPELHDARYVVGIDLGTTNTAMAFMDRESGARRIHTFAIPQLSAPGTIEARDVLPSFYYQPAHGEMTPESVCLPWQPAGDPSQPIMGILAREHGSEIPNRLVSSAKSWLCHGGVDRKAAVLPWHAAEDVKRASPQTVSAHYLQHLRDAWNASHPRHLLEDQDVVVTVPASFDEVARELTIDAAKEAGIPRIALIEEPQAAFYWWMHAHDDEKKLFAKGDIILICDIGGGTTDFTLIQVRKDKNDELAYHRIAVGNHLILGGDNLDLALARHLEARFKSEQQIELSPRQYSILVARCRRAKEVLLNPEAPKTTVINIPGQSTKLIGGSLNISVNHDEIQSVLVEGFLPQTSLSERPDQHHSGFREFGLPFAPDPAIPRYLAAFLTDHAATIDQDKPIRPTAVLFNGGFFESHVLRERLLNQISAWFTSDTDQPLQTLSNDRLDLAVARGAVAFGAARQTPGAKITAGLPRSYYIGAYDEAKKETYAICLVPTGTEEGEQIELPLDFNMTIGHPVEFPIYTSAFRTTDKPGDRIVIDPETLTALPPIRTVLRAGKSAKINTIAVRLFTIITEIGTLQVGCREMNGSRSWQLQFDVRSATQTDISAHDGEGERQGILPESQLNASKDIIRDVFEGTNAPASLVKKLEAATDLTRNQWPPSYLRFIWENLLHFETRRTRTETHEIRWLNLLGFSMRPGFGYGLDDWRISQTWRLYHRRMAHEKNEQCRGEWWILWRRISGGLSATQQQTLAAPLLAGLRAWDKGNRKRALKAQSNEWSEIWRMLAALEWLDVEHKIFLGETALKQIEKDGQQTWNKAAMWALGRLGAREPVYGPLNTVIPVEIIEGWIARLLKLDLSGPSAHQTLMLLARRTNDRYRDISNTKRSDIIHFMESNEAPEHLVTLVKTAGRLDQSESSGILGDSLPRGLTLRS